MRGYTGQVYNERVIVITGIGNALSAAKSFVDLVTGQYRLCGHNRGSIGDACDAFPILGNSERAYVDLEAWPADVAFGPWFEDWAEQWGLTLHD